MSPDAPASWEISRLRSQIESLLLVADQPVATEVLARLVEAEPAQVAAVCTQWAQELSERGSGIDLRCVEAAAGEAPGWRLYTSRDNAPTVEKFLLDGSQSRLSRAALETLAVVAYRQPVTRAQVSAVRGVNVDGVMRTLAVRGLIREVDPDPATGAHRWVTTELFLGQLGIDSLDRLPDLAPLLPDLDHIDLEDLPD